MKIEKIYSNLKRQKEGEKKTLMKKKLEIEGKIREK